MSSPPSPPSVVPGAWPDVLPDSPPPPHLDQVLSFHKRLSLSFSSPILMPTRSPLLALSPSASSMALTAGSQHDTSTSLSVFADESISTSYSSDSALEIASQSRPSEPAPNPYASPQISRNQHPFPTSPTEHLSRTTASYTSRRPPPRLTLSVPEIFNPSDENSNTLTTTTESPLASPVTPPSPSGSSSPGPIVFASPSSSSFSFRTPFPSLDPLSKTSGADHARVNVSNAHIRPDHASRANSYSTMGSNRTEPACLAEFPSPPRRPWRDFAKDNSRESSPSPSSEKNKRNIDDYPGSRRVLSTIQATTPLSSNRSHTLSLSLTRPSHTRASSSTSLFTPTKTPFRSNSISSPPLTPRSSFPSRSSSPAPARPSESESKFHKRPNSISLLRSISNRSKARFSRSMHTGDVSVAAVDYAAAQCEAAFVSETSHDQDEGGIDTEIVIKERTTGTLNEEMGSAEEAHVIDLDAAFEKVHHRSMLGKMKKFGGKVRKFVRVVRASLPSVGSQNEENVKVVNARDATTQTSPEIQSQSSSPRPRLIPARSSPPVLDKPSPPRRQPRSPRPGPSPTARPLSLSFPAMGGSFPGCPFVVPAIQISSPASSPPGISVPVPTFATATATAATATSKIRFSSIFPASSPPPPPSESESSSPTPTLQVEAMARARTKIEQSETADGLTGAAKGSSTSPATLRKAKTLLENRRPAEERERSRLRRATFSFNRMSSFWGWEGTPAQL